MKQPFQMKLPNLRNALVSNLFVSRMFTLSRPTQGVNSDELKITRCQNCGEKPLEYCSEFCKFFLISGILNLIAMLLYDLYSEEINRY